MSIFPLTHDVSLYVLISGPFAARNDGLAELIPDSDTILVDTAEKPRHALLLSELHKPDVVLLDLDMNESDLSKTISLLRQSASPPEIIVLGHNVPPLLRSNCMELGASYVIDKTSEIGELFAAMQVLRKWKAERPRQRRYMPIQPPFGAPAGLVAVNGHGDLNRKQG